MNYSYLYRLSIIILTLSGSYFTCGQDIYEMYDIYRNPIRVALNKVSWSFSTGYGGGNYSHNLKGFYYYQDPNGAFIIPKSNEVGLPGTMQGYTNWLNDPQPGPIIDTLLLFETPYDYLQNPVNNNLLKTTGVLIDGDTAALDFKGISNSIPINLSAHYDFYNFRIGFGGSFKKQWISKLKPNNYSDLVSVYTPNFKSTHYWKIYGTVGYRFYQFWDYSVVAELQIGKSWAGPQFNSTLINRGVYANLGLSIERELSEYVSFFVKPSFDYKKYSINFQGAPGVPQGNLSHQHNSLFVAIGITIKIPEIPRSPMPSDHVQLKHIITDPVSGRLMEVRGQTIWKKQNPKVGENHRKLFRYKLRNRKKLNPY